MVYSVSQLALSIGVQRGIFDRYLTSWMALMANVLKEAPLTTRSAGAKLSEGTHWRSIDPDTHLGYRKAPRGGRWLVRWYVGAQAYRQATLAKADDVFDADGVETLDFAQASAAARTHVSQVRADVRAETAGPPVSVRSAIEAYCDVREARERAQRGEKGLKRDARSRLALYVLSTVLADVPLHRLDEEALQAWRNALPASLAASSVRRLVNDFKAALNTAARTHRSRMPPELAGVIRHGLSTDAPARSEARKQILPDADVRRIITAAWEIDEARGFEGDLARLVLVLAATGARFSQVAGMFVSDVQAAEKRLMVPTSKKGRGTKRTGTIAVRVGEDVIEALRPATAGRKGPAPLLERWRSIQVKGATWERDRRGPWVNASELTRPWAEIIKKAGLPTDTVPYALRHSSIVRGLRAGLPVRLVAALHDTSSAMIEAHYAAYIVDALGELAAMAVVPLTTSPASVTAISRPRKKT